MAELGSIVKQVPNARLYESGLIRIDNVRGSYPHIAKPFKGRVDSANPNKVAKYGIKAMLPKSTHVAAKDLVVLAMGNLLAANRGKDGVPSVSSEKKFMRNGDDLEQEIYRGHWVVSASEERKPAMRNAVGEKIVDQEEIADLAVGGYWFNILIRPWYQDGIKSGAGFGRRLNAGLVGVQFVRKDEEFGEGRIDDSDAWNDAGSSGMDDNDDGL